MLLLLLSLPYYFFPLPILFFLSFLFFFPHVFLPCFQPVNDLASALFSFFPLCIPLPHYFLLPFSSSGCHISCPSFLTPSYFCHYCCSYLPFFSPSFVFLPSLPTLSSLLLSFVLSSLVSLTQSPFLTDPVSFRPFLFSLLSPPPPIPSDYFLLFHIYHSASENSCLGCIKLPLLFLLSILPSFILLVHSPSYFFVLCLTFLHDLHISSRLITRFIETSIQT